MGNERDLIPPNLVSEVGKKRVLILDLQGSDSGELRPQVRMVSSDTYVRPPTQNQNVSDHLQTS